MDPPAPRRLCLRRVENALAISMIVTAATCRAEVDLSMDNLGPACPNNTRILSTCLWDGKVGRNQLRNFSCIDSEEHSTPDSCAGRCCSACQEDNACHSWTYAGSSVAAKQHRSTCFLTTDTEAGDPGGPPGPGCTSAYKPPRPQPAPVPPPPGARNVLLIVVDDMRTQMNESYGNPFMITPNLYA